MKIVLIIFLAFISNYIIAQTAIDSTNIYTFYIDGIKYEIIKEGYNWVDAAKIADERGGILAEINSQKEQDSIFNHLNNAEINITKTVAPDGGGASYVWIGGNDIGIEGVWVWDGNNDRVGKQFWAGTKTGNSVGGLYNNWGNEPDNFSNQDAVGLAITNWPLGIAGQWNDVQDYNKLYSVIEYDNSTFKATRMDFIHQSNIINIEVDFLYAYDSIQVIVDGSVNETIFNIPNGNSVIESYFHPSETKFIAVYLQAFRNTSISYSNLFDMVVYSFANPILSYSTDFEDSPVDDFLYTEFDIVRYGGFRNKALHSLHNYDNSSEYIITIKTPFIVDPIKSQISYSDVAIVEPHDNGAIFGDEGFNDYVVVEGLKNGGDWLPLLPGYDAKKFSDWEMAWDTTAIYRNLFKRQTIELTDSFSTGDTIFIRFRLFSDNEKVGWGWVIDSLEIQDFPLNKTDDGTKLTNFRLEQNYPNPFNPSTTIKYSIPKDVRGEKQEVRLVVFDILGREVTTLVNKEQQPGNYEVQFNSSMLSSGVYFYTLKAGGFVATKKMLLMR